MIKINFPLYKLDVITEGLLELCAGLGFDINSASIIKKREKKISSIVVQPLFCSTGE